MSITAWAKHCYSDRQGDSKSLEGHADHWEKYDVDRIRYSGASFFVVVSNVGKQQNRIGEKGVVSAEEIRQFDGTPCRGMNL